MEDRKIGPATVLFGERRGKYPDGNPLLVEGREESLIIDPSLAMIPRRDRLPSVDRVLNSHCHEDHIAGNYLFPDLPWHFHELDLPGIRSLDGLMGVYGLPKEIEKEFRLLVQEKFHFMPKEDALSFRDGDVFDLGSKTVTVVHTPGHTRGHCCFLIEGAGDEGAMLYLGDIDLTSFGPYYGDIWSSLEDFERSIALVREIKVEWYATFHHIGVLKRVEFLERLERFAAVIEKREQRLLEYIKVPRTIENIVQHRFVYRPGDQVLFADPVERFSMTDHLIRLQSQKRVREVEQETWVAV
ncbi:MAG: MBL fold metallo-hydrolase [SAR324 cluster bacterium]|nr:MBL fold metallo-hydrolase [SAR324 cluster bacterium]